MALGVKNFGLTAAATDLGLGDSLKSQLELQEEERKKKLLARSQANAGGALGPGTMALYGQTGGFSV